MFGLSGEHLLVILVILLLFGPKRLPDLGNSLGKTIKNFKDAMSGKEDAPVPAPPQEALQAKSANNPQLTAVPNSNVQDAQTVNATEKDPSHKA